MPTPALMAAKTTDKAIAVVRFIVWSPIGIFTLNSKRNFARLAGPGARRWRSHARVRASRSAPVPRNDRSPAGSAATRYGPWLMLVMSVSNVTLAIVIGSPAPLVTNDPIARHPQPAARACWTTRPANRPTADRRRVAGRPAQRAERCALTAIGDDGEERLARRAELILNGAARRHSSRCRQSRTTYTVANRNRFMHRP